MGAHDRERHVLGWVIGVTGFGVIGSTVLAVLRIPLHEHAREVALWATPFAAFIPGIAAIAALAALILAYRNYRLATAAQAQRRMADDRAEWWRRVQSAVDLVVSSDGDCSETGFEMLTALRDAPGVPDEDKRFAADLHLTLTVDVRRSLVADGDTPASAAESRARSARDPWPSRIGLTRLHAYIKSRRS